MIETPIKSTALAALVGIALAAPCAQAQGDLPADSKYRLQIASEDYRVQANSVYQLAAKYRRPDSTADSPAPQQERPAPNLYAVALKPYAREIERAALEASVDPALVHAVIHIESAYRHDAVSPKGALGLMQVMPGTAARYGVVGARPTVKKNLDVGTRYLRDLMRMFDDRLDLVLAAYNAGEGAVRRYSDRIPPYPETQSYVRSVLARYAELGGIVARRVTPDAQAAKRSALPSAGRTASVR